MKKVRTTITYFEAWLRCPNLKCLYEWLYKGKSDYRATCPKCHKCFPIKKNEVLRDSNNGNK